MAVGSFFKKISQAVRSAPLAFVFLALAVIATSLVYSSARTLVFAESGERFAIVAKELRSVVASRLNRVIDLPIALSKGFRIDSTKGELDAYADSLELDARYPGVRELGIYATSGQDLRRLYRYTVGYPRDQATVSQTGVPAGSVTEQELRDSATIAKTSPTSGPAFVIKIREGDPRYLVLVPTGRESYFFMTFDAAAVLGRLFIENGIYDQVQFKIFDASDPDFVLFETQPEDITKSSHDHLIFEQIKVGLYPWSLAVSGEVKNLVVGTAKTLPIVILFSGLAISFLITGVLYVLSRSRFKALDLAKSMTKSLRQSEEKYRNIFEKLQDVYYRADEKGQITVVSPSVEQYTGLKPDELIGQSAEAFYRNPKDRQNLLFKLEKEGAVKDYPIVLKGRKGEIVYCSLNARLGQDENGRFVEGMIRDVSERRVANEALRERTKELERLNSLMVNRELRMVELKEEIARLKSRKSNGKN